MGSKFQGVQPLVEPITLEEGAYWELRRVITDGVLGPGDRISINALSQRMGVSRLPVIHALRRLASEGFVKIRPHKSPTVNQPTPTDIRVRMVMMASLEEIAVKEAWPLAPALLTEMEAFHERARQEIEAGVSNDETDWRFHEVVWRAPGIEQLRFTIQTLWDQGAYYRTIGLKSHAAMRSRLVEHSAILHAFQVSRLDATIACVREHRLASMERLQHFFGDGHAAMTDLTGAAAEPTPEDGAADSDLADEG